MTTSKETSSPDKPPKRYMTDFELAVLSKIETAELVRWHHDATIFVKHNAHRIELRFDPNEAIFEPFNSDRFHFSLKAIQDELTRRGEDTSAYAYLRSIQYRTMSQRREENQRQGRRKNIRRKSPNFR